MKKLIYISALLFCTQAFSNNYEDYYDETLITNFSKSIVEMSVVIDRFQALKNDPNNNYTKKELSDKLNMEIIKVLEKNNITKEQYQNIINQAKNDELLREFIIEKQIEIKTDQKTY